MSNRNVLNKQKLALSKIQYGIRSYQYLYPKQQINTGISEIKKPKPIRFKTPVQTR